MNPMLRAVLIYIHRDLESKEDKSNRIISVHKLAKHLQISRQDTKRYLLLLGKLKKIVFDDTYPVSSALYQGSIRIARVNIAPRKKKECI